MKYIASLLFVCLLAAGNAFAVSGYISADENWSGTVTIDDDLEIRGGTVTIAPGTRIEAAAGAQISITGAGAINASGTADNMIVFTSAAGSPAAGDWAGLYFNVCFNEANMVFEYCIIEYAGTGMHSGNWGDSASIAEPSDVTVDHCIFRHMSSNGLYGTARADMRVNNSLIYDCKHSGIFFHGTDSSYITNTVLYDISTAIVCPGSDEAARHYEIDHVTIYNVDMMMAGDTPKWWHGYAIFTANTKGTIEVTNSIVVQATLAGLIINGWTITNNNNCWSTGMTGIANIEDGAPGAGSIEQDPLFVDVAARDLRLDAMSPAAATASDGTNMGALPLQSGTAWYAAYVSGIHDAGTLTGALPGIDIRPDGLAGTVTVSAAAAHGAALYVNGLDGAAALRLTGSIDAGTSTYSLAGLRPGVYVVTLVDGNDVLGAAQVAVIR